MSPPRLQVRDALGVWTADIDRTPFSIGRRDGNDLRLGATEVSREHAEIVERDGRYVLRDRQSRYGTFVAGEPISECELKSGDEIRLGRAGGATLVFIGTEDSTVEATPNPRENLRLLLEALDRLRRASTGRILQDVLALLLDAALELTGADRAFVMLAGKGGALEFRMGRAQGGRSLTGSDFETSRQVPAEVFRTGETMALQDLFDPAVGDHMATRGLGIRHIICVPLHQFQIVESAEADSAPQRIGVLYLDGRARGSLVSAVTRSALETLAAEASLAIENARLYRRRLDQDRLEQELRVAADIQRALLPQARIALPYLNVAAATRPSRSIGGDLFDYPRQTSPAFAFAVGDVAGKGPPAALMSALMQGMFAAIGKEQFAQGPATVVTLINQALCQRGLEARFVTLFLGVIAEDGSVTYCNAGHCPPIVAGRAGIRRLEAGGPVCGLFDSAAYEQHTVTLDPGDAVVVFSDGVSDATNDAEQEFGEPRLIEIVQRAGHGSAQELVDAITTAVEAHTGDAPQSDDITIMAIRYHGAQD